MSQQTINVGAAPNDGTGTPLRTAFQYTNANFTELYTALGGGVGLPGATTQVIFNDGGTNLAGDAGLTYNKTTDTLSMGAATITGDLTVDTNVLKVDSAANNVGINQSNPGVWLVNGLGIGSGSGDAGATIYTGTANTGYLCFADGTTTTDRYRGYIGYFHNVDSLTFGTSAIEGMRLNSTGLFLGASSQAFSEKFRVYGAYTVMDDGAFTGFLGKASSLGVSGATTDFGIRSSNALIFLAGGATERMRIDSSGNVGVGVAPSAWASAFRTLQIAGTGAYLSSYTSGSTINQYIYVGNNSFYNGTSSRWEYIRSKPSAQYIQYNSEHQWWRDTGTQTAGADCAFTQAMTLTAGGELLIGATSGSGGRLWVQAAGSTEAAEIARLTASNTFNTLISYVVQAEGYNAGATALKVGKNTTTSRSINAGGTVNASGADYAEYMTKASDFVLAKGDVAGIDANGKLTNVFADAVSFVVKSTDPSYVGNDKWGVGLEGADLEAARQLVDRMAFAGQVPVNVTGAKAGDYIVPVVNGTGIKGQAVSNPTFEQYQLAVGKVISIDADGRARIIVKLA